MIYGDDVVTEARDWIGTRWQHQAMLKGVACDCIGLISGVALALGIPEALAWTQDTRFMGYGRTPNAALLIEACDTYLDRVPLDGLQLGDIPVFRFERDPQHFGILSALDPRYVIHSYAQARRVVENRIDEKWASRIMRAYRFRGVQQWPPKVLPPGFFGPPGAIVGWSVG